MKNLENPIHKDAEVYFKVKVIQIKKFVRHVTKEKIKGTRSNKTELKLCVQWKKAMESVGALSKGIIFLYSMVGVSDNLPSTYWDIISLYLK